jgi:hypothetical protein
MLRFGSVKLSESDLMMMEKLVAMLVTNRKVVR